MDTHGRLLQLTLLLHEALLRGWSSCHHWVLLIAVIAAGVALHTLVPAARIVLQRVNDAPATSSPPRNPFDGPCMLLAVLPLIVLLLVALPLVSVQQLEALAG